MMLLNAKNCYQALRTHDARFDGRFFVGVTSTQIYCRPICSVKTPKFENCEFYATAAIAESRGFRPCLRCRPELAPGNSSFDRSGQLAQSVVNLVEGGFLDDYSISDLADHLGVTDRHLRRVFQAEYGISIVEHLQTQRLLIAKQLLTDTHLPVTEIAFTSGFASLRRFNDSFKQRYRLKPTEIRKAGSAGIQKDTFSFALGYRPPYDHQTLLQFLSARMIPGVEDLVDGHYLRTVTMDQRGKTYSGWFDASFDKQKPQVNVLISKSLAKVIPQVLNKIKRLFDLSCDPTQIETVLLSLKLNEGLRVPGSFDGFEMAVRAILGQQISVKAAKTFAHRIAVRFGTPIETPHANVTHIFPSASVIAKCTTEELGKLGIIRTRSESLIELAQAVATQKIILGPNANVAKTMTALKDIPGIGEWTAQYIAMRALAWPDAFPHTDLGIKKALNETRHAKVLAMSEQWRPWRSYATIGLWNSLSQPKNPKVEVNHVR